jgi:hypothetical protein
MGDDGQFLGSRGMPANPPQIMGVGGNALLLPLSCKRIL